MEVHVRTTIAANALLRTRDHLAAMLGVDTDFIASVVATPNRFYTQFPIGKANGETRLIKPPCKSLRKVQRTLLLELYRRVRLRSCLHGGIRKRSIVTHAQAHVGQLMVATLDVRKFFPSTTRAHLEPVIGALGFLDEAALDLLSLVMLDGELPQGAPSSSLLANLAFAVGDSEFIRICGPRRLNYSRYVDDIAVSGNYDFTHLRGKFVEAIELARYKIAPEKIHFMRHHERQVVTGLVVNQKLRPTGEYVAALKCDIRNCREHGAQLIADTQGVTVQQLKNQLTGRVAHIKHVDAVKGRRLRGLLCSIDWKSTSPRVENDKAVVVIGRTMERKRGHCTFLKNQNVPFDSPQDLPLIHDLPLETLDQ